MPVGGWYVAKPPAQSAHIIEVQAPILMLGFSTSWSFATRPEKIEKDTRNDMLVPLGLENRSQKL
jgi:hypothetical protein